MQVNSTQGTFAVAAVLCVVCSFFVAGTAQALKEKIQKNEDLDRKKNILVAAGKYDPKSDKAQSIDTIYQESMTEVLVDLSSGEVIEGDAIPEGYDPQKASRDPSMQVQVTNNALMGIKFREPYAPIYRIKDGGYVLPIYGKGLWGTLWGFLALEGDAKTIKGITFYKHKETPGLGAEVDNPIWKAKWPGKTGINDQGEVVVQVKKGQTPSDSPAAAYTIDGLSGATITTKGVDHLVSYWLSDDGFGKYLAKQ